MTIRVGDEIKFQSVDGLSDSEQPTYKVVYVTNQNRVIIAYDGGDLVLVDNGADGKWAFSGEPATPEEEAFIGANMPAVDTTDVTVTKDGE